MLFSPLFILVNILHKQCIDIYIQYTHGEMVKCLTFISEHPLCLTECMYTVHI